MIERAHDLPLATQAGLLGIARSTVYREPAPVSATDLATMRRIDELHLDYPFAGSRMLRVMLANEGKAVGRTHVRTLTRRMGIEALYRRPRTSKPAPGHKIYPYLLRDIAVTRPNQVWAMDITYIPMARGFVYLVVVLDWFTRRALSWRVWITLEADFCIEARGGLSRSLRHGCRGAGMDWPVSGLLQCRAAAFAARWPDAGSGLVRQLAGDASWRGSLRPAYGSACVHTARARLSEQRNRGTIHL
jgi:hypothetical protein